MLDVEYLSKATFKLGRILAKSKSENFSFSDDFLFSDDLDDDDENDDELYEDVIVGLVYRIDSDGQTFCIRGVVSADIHRTLSTLKDDRNAEVKKRLKLMDDFVDDVHYFKTEDLELAKIIYKKLINKRFPIFEEVLCNLSDPGFSWWMDAKENSITIYFKSHGINRAEKLVKLGPVGDNQAARKIFKNSYDIFSLLFKIDEFSCSNKSLHISTSDQDSEGFKIFKNLLLKGRNRFNEEYPFVGENGKGLYCFLNDLSILRKFWICVERELNSVSENCILQ